MHRCIAITIILLGLGRGLATAELLVDADQRFQVFRGFGTCMVSFGNPSRNKALDWQEDPRIHQSYVRDLGLKVIRIPLSPWVIAGENPYKIPVNLTEAMKGDPSAIVHEAFVWERNDGRAQGQPNRSISWIKELTALDSEMTVIASVWTPPHWMKEAASSGPGKRFEWSQFGSNSCGGRLSPRYYQHFAHYLAAWVKGLKAVHGIDLHAISIQNELVFYEPYDSCVYSPREFAAVCAEVGRVFKEQGLTTLIIGPEDMTKFPDRCMSFVKEVMANPVAADALSAVCSHGYADGIETSLDWKDADELWKLMQGICPGKEYWMTETGGGSGAWEDSTYTITAGKRKGQQAVSPGALNGFASMVHGALVYGNASLWATWQFLSTEPDCRGGLVDVSGAEPVYPKKYYVQKQFSRWIRPGSRRVAASFAGDSKELLVCAFRDEKTGDLTMILQNHGQEAQQIDLNIAMKDPSQLRAGPITLRAHLTDIDHDCAEIPTVVLQAGRAQLELPARCLLTVTTIERP